MKCTKCKTSNASARKNRVVLSSRTEGSVDANGYRNPASYSTVRSFWAAIKHRSWRESQDDGRLQEFVTTIFETDYNNVSDLLASSKRNEYKLTYNSVDYNIISVIDVDEQHRSVELHCVRGEAP